MNGQAASPFGVVLVDGDAMPFVDRHLGTGYQGGKAASRGLRQNLLARLPGRLEVDEHLPIAATYFISQLKQATALRKEQGKEARTREFAEGFNLQHPLNSLINIGWSENDPGRNLKAQLELFSSIPSCRFLVVGVYDGHYADSLKIAAERTNIVLIGSSEDRPVPPALAELDLQQIVIEDLFRNAYTTPDTPPESPKYVPPGMRSFRVEGKRPLDRSKSIRKQSPRPCYQHYVLAACHHSCEYAHDFDMDEDDVAQMVAEYKQVPCMYYESNGYCVREDECWYGHGDGTSTSPTSPASDRAGPWRRSSLSVSRLRPDPEKPYMKQSPRICFGFHIGRCKKLSGHDNLSHLYDLTEDEVEEMKAECKRYPCPWGEECRWGDDCRNQH